MQKIEIKNFGPITEAKIEIKKTVVLIGEQASGKSTIAKLIYFFKSLREDLFNAIYDQSVESEDFSFDYIKLLIVPAREKFYDFFGSTSHMGNFEIKFYYSIEENKYLELTLNKVKRLNPTFSDEFKLRELGGLIKRIVRLLPNNVNEGKISDVLAYNQEKLRYAEQLSDLLKKTFCCEQDDNLFIIAGRNATVGYSESFEKQFFLDAKKQMEKSFQKKHQTIDETLMLNFMNRVVYMKDIFRKFGDFEEVLKVMSIEKQQKSTLIEIIKSINEILKGKYTADDFGEKIVFNSETNEYVYLSNASSGQQEVIRILQDIFLSVAQNNNVLRIVEEPEAHLFPLAQKKVIELLVQMTKRNGNNQLIITTHSPYVLTVFNNLLFAQRVIEQNPDADNEVSSIIGKEAHLKPSDFSAYVLAQNDEKNNEIIAESIIDEGTGMITQNYLDTVSEVLGNEFNALYSIHSKAFKRQ